MTKKRFADIEAALLESQAGLQRRLRAIRADRRHEKQPLDKDLEDQAVQRENDDTLDALDDQGRRELEAIESALRRLELGTFDQCVSCGETIPENRLRAVPAAGSCLACAQAASGK